MPQVGNRDPFTVIVIAGQETSADIQFALSLLARLGLGPEVVHDYEYLRETEPDPERYPIDRITNREQWLGKEHFLSFRDHYALEQKRTIATRVFNAATDSGNYLASPPLQIKHRSKTPLGLDIPEEYRRAQVPKHLQKYEDRAIRVSSFLDFSVPMILGASQRSPRNVGVGARQFTSRMALWLEARTNPQEVAEAET